MGPLSSASAYLSEDAGSWDSLKFCTSAIWLILERFSMLVFYSNLLIIIILRPWTWSE